MKNITLSQKAVVGMYDKTGINSLYFGIHKIKYIINSGYIIPSGYDDVGINI